MDTVQAAADDGLGARMALEAKTARDIVDRFDKSDNAKGLVPTFGRAVSNDEWQLLLTSSIAHSLSVLALAAAERQSDIEDDISADDDRTGDQSSKPRPKPFRFA